MNLRGNRVRRRGCLGVRVVKGTVLGFRRNCNHRLRRRVDLAPDVTHVAEGRRYRKPRGEDERADFRHDHTL